MRKIVVTMLVAACVLAVSIVVAESKDPDINRLLFSPVAQDWITNGGNATNQRYSTLRQINRSNVGQLKGAWMTHLNGSGMGGKYSLEGSPLVRDGMMYISTGNDDVFALRAKTGEIVWQHQSGLDQKISTVCCGWANRGLALGEGMLFIGQLDANVVALDVNTGAVAWKTPIEKWESGYGITSAPLYYDGIVYSGITGGEFGVRGRLTALDAKTGAILWRWFTLPGPGGVGSETWPAGTSDAMRGGAAIWNTPAADPSLGLLYFSVGNRGPDYDGAVRPGDDLFCTSIVALKAKTGEYAWHFQEVHHDLWDYDAASPVVLFDTVTDGQPRKRIAEAGRTGWLYLLDRTNGKPLTGIEEKPVPQEKRQNTAATQPFPVGDATVPQCAEPMPGYDEAGCIFQPFWETPVLVQPGGLGGTNWSPAPYSPETGFFYVSGPVRSSAFFRYPNPYVQGQRFSGGTQTAPIGTPMSGTFTAIDSRTNRIAWQHKTTNRIGGGSGATVTAGGLVFRGDPDGHVLALDATTGAELWRFQSGFGADAPPVVYEVKGEEFVAIATGGNQFMGSATGDAVWSFSLKGNLSPLLAPPAPAVVAGPSGPMAPGVDLIKIGSNNAEFGFAPSRTRVKAGTAVTFINTGDLPHSAIALPSDWDTGLLTKEASKTITFKEAGTYNYICSPHPWMYGQIIVEK